MILERGSKGERVIVLQRLLRNAGYHIYVGFNDSDFIVDGIFGKITESVLNSYLTKIGRELLPPTYIDDYKIMYLGSEWRELERKASEKSAINSDKATNMTAENKNKNDSNVTPAYKKDTTDSNTTDSNTMDAIISKLEVKGYGYMHKALIDNWECILTKVPESSGKSELVKYIKSYDKRKAGGTSEISSNLFFWEKVAYICRQILSSSGKAPNFFSMNDENKLLLTLDDDKLNRLPRWVNIGDELKNLQKGRNNLHKGWEYLKIKNDNPIWGTYWSFDTLNRINEALKNAIDFGIGLEKLSSEEVTEITKNIKKYKVTITSLSPGYGYRSLGATHKTGLDIDFRVITSNVHGGYTEYIKNGKVVKASENYDQNGQRYFLRLLNKLNESKKIKIRLRWIKEDKKYVIGKPIFNDGVLIKEGLCVEVPGHHNHVHLQIGEPP